MYAGTLDKGAFKSTNGGVTWNPINAGLPGGSTSIVPAVAIDPTTPTTLYAATFGDGIFKSLNGGTNWFPANAGLTGDAARLKTVTVAVDARSLSTLYLGTLAAGAFKSVDNGNNWFPIPGLPEASFVTVVTAHPRLPLSPGAPSTLYAGLFGDKGIFKSTDGGATWSPRNAGLGASFMLAVAADPGNPATLYAGAYRQKVFKSTNGGVTWAARDNGITDATVNALAVSPLGVPGTVFAGASQHSRFLSASALGSGGSEVIGPPGPGGVFRSLDGGASWSKVLTTSVAVQALAIDPGNPLIVYAGTLGGEKLFKSTNGGTSWNPMNTGLLDGDVYALAIHGPAAGVPAAVYAGTFGALGGRVLKTTNGGLTWTDTGLRAGGPVAALAVPSPSPSTVYAGTWGGGAFKTVNGGSSWAPIASLDQAAGAIVFALAVDPQVPATVYAGSYDRGVTKSLNGGQTWAPSNAGLSVDAVVHALALNPGGTCLHAGTGGSVYDFATAPSSQCPPPPTLRATLTKLGTEPGPGGTTTIRTRAVVVNTGAAASTSGAVPDADDDLGVSCGITQLSGADTSSSFQAVNAMDQPIAALNAPVDIDGSQAFLLPFLSDPQQCPVEIQLAYKCTNTEPAPVLVGTEGNTLQVGGASCGLSVSLTASQPTFVVGQTLHLGGSLTNSGVPGTAADFYAGVLRPNGTVQFLTSTGPAEGSVASPTPAVVNVPLGTPIPTLTVSDVFPPRQWQATDPRGHYIFFFLAVRTGGTIANDLLHLATASYSFP